MNGKKITPELVNVIQVLFNSGMNKYQVAETLKMGASTADMIKSNNFDYAQYRAYVQKAKQHSVVKAKKAKGTEPVAPTESVEKPATSLGELQKSVAEAREIKIDDNKQLKRIVNLLTITNDKLDELITTIHRLNPPQERKGLFNR